MNRSAIFSIKNILIYTLLFSILSGCKKGSGDPANSLLTRKNRLTGKWRIASGKATAYHYEYIFNTIGVRIYDVDQMVYSDEKYNLNLEILKDGTFNFTETMTLSTLVAKGTWNFNSGVGEDKKKEKVFFHISDVPQGFTFGYHVFNQWSTDFSYHLVELRNKKLVLKCNGLIYNYNNTPEYFSANYTFTQD